MKDGLYWLIRSDNEPQAVVVRVPEHDWRPSAYDALTGRPLGRVDDIEAANWQPIAAVRPDGFEQFNCRLLGRVQELEDALEEVGRQCLHDERSILWRTVLRTVGKNGQRRQTIEGANYSGQRREGATPPLGVFTTTTEDF